MGSIHEKLETDRPGPSQLYKRWRRPNVQFNQKVIMKSRGPLIVPPREYTLSKQRGSTSLRMPKQVAVEDEHTVVRGSRGGGGGGGARLFVRR